MSKPGRSFEKMTTIRLDHELILAIEQHKARMMEMFPGIPVSAESAMRNLMMIGAKTLEEREKAAIEETT